MDCSRACVLADHRNRKIHFRQPLTFFGDYQTLPISSSAQRTTSSAMETASAYSCSETGRAKARITGDQCVSG